ncbi:unnamed protein product [Brassica rapa]|nr:unnamed protein product [Brassica napus]CAG7890296.1 unnamed protein product [Brassica rapa]CDY51736.1 BnaA01g37190D [Brassica napus]VDC77522.1 unnamed protein product [Brassica rapa]
MMECRDKKESHVSEGFKEWLEWPLEFVGYVETDSASWTCVLI